MCKGITGTDLSTIVHKSIYSINKTEYRGNVIIRTSRINPRSFDFTLGVNDSSGHGAAVTRSGRRSAHACWHAHRDLIMVMFGQEPFLVLRSLYMGRITYNGFSSFMDLYPGTGEVNIGYMTEPVRACDACRCDLGVYHQTPGMKGLISSIITEVTK
jgi:hypothetical protein